jgi:uncharacterized protein (TIGR03437 family)
VALFGTGLGTGAGSPVAVRIAGIEVQPQYVGPAPNLEGVFQVNVMVPQDLAPGVGTVSLLRAASRPMP